MSGTENNSFDLLSEKDLRAACKDAKTPEEVEGLCGLFENLGYQKLRAELKKWGVDIDLILYER